MPIDEKLLNKPAENNPEVIGILADKFFDVGVMNGAFSRSGQSSELERKKSKELAKEFLNFYRGIYKFEGAGLITIGQTFELIDTLNKYFKCGHPGFLEGALLTIAKETSTVQQSIWDEIWMQQGIEKYPGLKDKYPYEIRSILENTFGFARPRVAADVSDSVQLIDIYGTIAKERSIPYSDTDVARASAYTLKVLGLAGFSTAEVSLLVDSYADYSNFNLLSLSCVVKDTVKWMGENKINIGDMVGSNTEQGLIQKSHSVLESQSRYGKLKDRYSKLDGETAIRRYAGKIAYPFQRAVAWQPKYTSEQIFEEAKKNYDLFKE